MRNASMNIATHKRHLWILLISLYSVACDGHDRKLAHLHHTAWTFKGGAPRKSILWPRHLTVSCGWGPRPDSFILPGFVFSNISLHQIRNSTGAGSDLFLRHQTAAGHG